MSALDSTDSTDSTVDLSLEAVEASDVRATPERHHSDRISPSSTHHACPEATCAANPMMISASLESTRKGHWVKVGERAEQVK